VVIWDKILRSRGFHRLDLSGFRSKYLAADVDGELGMSGKEATLKVYWNTMPHVGYLFDTQKGMTSTTIPTVQYN
jgi:hypothetical protein